VVGALAAESAVPAPPGAAGLPLVAIPGYTILSMVGEGGMGVGYKAEDIRLGRVVALKVMKPDAVAKPNARQRFHREAQAAASLRHEHIVTTYQIGYFPGFRWAEWNGRFWRCSGSRG
jgi:serine/threonine protein kinase